MRRTRITTAVLALLLFIGACAGGDDDTASDSAGDAGDAASEPTVATEGEALGDGSDTASRAAGGGAPAGGSEGADGSVTDVADIDLVAAQVDRKIVYTGEVQSEVDDVASAVRSARDAVAAEGGFVFGQEIGETDARVVLKVPAVRFDAAFDAVAGIGEVTHQFIEADDVSEQYTDLESRLATLATSIDRLRGFLAQAANVDEISRLETELTRREAEHDVIAGQLRVLRDRTALGTITALFVSVEDDAEVAVAGEDGGPPGFGRGLEVGWDAVVVIVGAVATATGFALPFTPLLVVVALLLWWQRRRFSRAVAPGRA